MNYELYGSGILKSDKLWNQIIDSADCGCSSIKLPADILPAPQNVWCAGIAAWSVHQRKGAIQWSISRQRQIHSSSRINPIIFGSSRSECLNRFFSIFAITIPKISILGIVMPVYFPLCVSLKYCLNLIIESPLYAKAVQMISALL